MQPSTLLAGLLLSLSTLISAEWGLRSPFPTATTVPVEPAKKLSQVFHAMYTYETHLTADPKYASVTEVVHDYLATATDVPAAVTETGTTTMYTTVPKWFTGLPGDVQQYFVSVAEVKASIANSVWEAAAPRATPAAGGRGVSGAAGVAAVGAVGAMLL